MVALLHFVIHIIFMVGVKAIENGLFMEDTSGESIHEHARCSLQNPVAFEVEKPVFEDKILTKTPSLQKMDAKWKDANESRWKDIESKEETNKVKEIGTLEQGKSLGDRKSTSIDRKSATFFLYDPNEVIRTSASLETTKTLELDANLREVKQESREDAIGSECTGDKEQNIKEDPEKTSLIAPQTLENIVLSKQTDTEIETSSAKSPNKGWLNIRNFLYRNTWKTYSVQRQSVTSKDQTNEGEHKNENLSNAKSEEVKLNIFIWIFRKLFTTKKRNDNDPIQKPIENLNGSISNTLVDKNTEGLGEPGQADAQFSLKEKSQSSDSDRLASELAKQLQTTPGLVKACTSSKNKVSFIFQIKRFFTNLFTRKLPNESFEMISNDETNCQEMIKDVFSTIETVPAPLFTVDDAITATNDKLQVSNQTPKKSLCRESNAQGDAAGIILNTSRAINEAPEEINAKTDQKNIDMKEKQPVSESELNQNNSKRAGGITAPILQAQIAEMKEKKRQKNIDAAKNITDDKPSIEKSSNTDENCANPSAQTDKKSSFFDIMNKAIVYDDKKGNPDENDAKKLQDSDYDENAFDDDTEPKTCSESDKVISESIKLQKNSSVAVLTDLTEEACETQSKETDGRCEKTESASETDNVAKDPILTTTTPTLPCANFDGEGIQTKEIVQPKNDKFEDEVYDLLAQKDGIKFKHLKYLLNTFEKNDWLKQGLHQFPESNKLINLSKDDNPNCIQLLYNLATAIKGGKAGTIITTKSNANFWLKEYINGSKINQEDDSKIQKAIDDLFESQTALLKAKLLQN